MATERASRRDDRPHDPDELHHDEFVTDELPSITEQDVTRVIRKLEAGRATDSYTFGPADFDMFMYLSPGQWREVKDSPASLSDLLAPYTNA